MYSLLYSQDSSSAIIYKEINFLDNIGFCLCSSWPTTLASSMIPMCNITNLYVVFILCREGLGEHYHDSYRRTEYRISFDYYFFKLNHFTPCKKNIEKPEEDRIGNRLIKKDSFHLAWLFSNYYILRTSIKRL